MTGEEFCFSRLGPTKNYLFSKSTLANKHKSRYVSISIKKLIIFVKNIDVGYSTYDINELYPI
jgi:hypothetical protein